MRVLVTGGAGFIGAHLVKALRGADHEVAILDRAPAAYTVQQYGFDIRDRRDVVAAFRDFLPDAVCHLAAQVSVPKSFRDPYADSETNVLGSINVLDAARANGVRDFVFASSGGAIYGDVPSGSSSELDAPRVASPYGASKLAFEQIMFSTVRDDEVRCRSLRLSNVYGPGQRSGVVPSFMNAILSGAPLRVFGNCTRDYVHVNDVVDAFVAALDGRIPWRVMNVATGIGTGTLELAATIKSWADRDDMVLDGFRDGDVTRSVLDASRFLQRVGVPTPLLYGLLNTRNRWNDG